MRHALPQQLTSHQVAPALACISPIELKASRVRVWLGQRFAGTGCEFAQEPYSVRLEEHDGGHLSKGALRRAKDMLCKTGFVILRGGSLYSATELTDVQSSTGRELSRLKDHCEKFGLTESAPWFHHRRRRSLSSPAEFEFKEAISYSAGRLDMPHLIDKKPFNRLPWRSNPDIIQLCEDVLGRQCEQSVFGALWSFPGACETGWHRDGESPMLVVVTAACDYPVDIGWIHLRPHSHLQTSRADGEQTSRHKLRPVPAVLRRGESVIFMYSCIHAGMANLTNLERCLLYSVYGPVGVYDTINHDPGFPSLAIAEEPQKRTSIHDEL